ncbi:MAG TPA: Jag N-terminal domain-containing protein, partial [Acidimicrobiales bacterium]|nr:Jag N-terminal domain-containing protein [Acidimicrobiales bacterium]
MQWVVTTGRTVEEARLRALEALGVDDADLELEVLAQPSSRLFGLRRTEARVRARVRPTRPRPKVDRRNRRKSPGASGGARRRRSGRRDEKPARAQPAADPVPATVETPDAGHAPTPSDDQRRLDPGRTRPASAAGRPTPDPHDMGQDGPTGDTMRDITLDE